MKDFIKNIESTRNSEEQMQYMERMNTFVETADAGLMMKMKAFPVYSQRQVITSFLERYEIYKLIKNVPGSMVECGVGSGFGLMAFAHFCSIFEPYHYVRKVIGFDTFEGFTGISEKDQTSRAGHLKEGGLNFGSYDILQQAVALYDMNRVLGHLNKVQLVKGDISRTLPEYLDENPSLVVALLYLDLDLYQPTLDTLKLLVKRVPKGGVIAFDELNHTDYPGETIAAMETIGIQNLKLKRFDISSMLAYAVVE